MNSSDTEDFVRMFPKKRNLRRLYLVSYSKANMTKFPTRQNFAEVVVNLISLSENSLSSIGPVVLRNTKTPWDSIFNWVKVFKNEPSKICGRQPLKNLKGYGLLKALSSARLSSASFTWSILEYFVSNNIKKVSTALKTWTVC